MKQDKEFIAQVAHNVNRAFSQSIGDSSHKLWQDAPQWQKDSAVAGVEAHLEKDYSPEESHRIWSEKKIADGWKWGFIKDEQAKTHPSLVPYDELPDEEKTKDFLFKAVVDTFKNA